MVDPIYEFFKTAEFWLMVAIFFICAMQMCYFEDIKPKLDKLKKLEEKERKRHVRNHLNNNSNGHLYNWADDDM